MHLESNPIQTMSFQNSKSPQKQNGYSSASLNCLYILLDCIKKGLNSYFLISQHDAFDYVQCAYSRYATFYVPNKDIWPRL